MTTQELIIRSHQNPTYLSNTYLVYELPSRQACLIDCAAPPETFAAEISRFDLDLQAILITHSHYDHISQLSTWCRKHNLTIYAHNSISFDQHQKHVKLFDSEEITMGGLQVKVLATPGHVATHIAYIINQKSVFTGDLLFRGSVGTTTKGSFEQLQHSILEVIMPLPAESAIYPGHGEPSTIGGEWEQNPFIRIWRGLDLPDNRVCTISGKPGILYLTTNDYDGETKAWVQLDGLDQIISDDTITI